VHVVHWFLLALPVALAFLFLVRLHIRFRLNANAWTAAFEKLLLAKNRTRAFKLLRAVSPRMPIARLTHDALALRLPAQDPNAVTRAYREAPAGASLEERAFGVLRARARTQWRRVRPLYRAAAGLGLLALPLAGIYAAAGLAPPPGAWALAGFGALLSVHALRLHRSDWRALEDAARRLAPHVAAEGSGAPGPPPMAPMPRRRVDGMLLLGAAFALVAVGDVVEEQVFAADAARTVGVVVDHVVMEDDGSESFAAVFRYQVGGEVHTHQSHVFSDPPTVARGERRGVLYDPDDPEDARLDVFWERYLLAVVFGILGLFLFGLRLAGDRRIGST